MVTKGEETVLSTHSVYVQGPPSGCTFNPDPDLRSHLLFSMNDNNSNLEVCKFISNVNITFVMQRICSASGIHFSPTENGMFYPSESF